MTRSGNTKGNTKLTKLTTVDHDTRLQVYGIAPSKACYESIYTLKTHKIIDNGDRNLTRARETSCKYSVKKKIHH